MNRPARTQAGFTLLEVMIALALMTVILAAAFITQSSSITSSGRSKNIIIATNLARNLFNELEVKYENLPFDRLPKSETKNFAEPNQQFKYTVEIEEVDFSALSDLLLKAGTKEGDVNAEQAPTMIRLFKEYLQKSVRRMKVTVEWPEGDGRSQQTFSELLVNYDAEFSTAI